MTTDNFCFYLQNRLIQSSQTGGQQYRDTSPLVFPGEGHGQTLINRTKPRSSFQLYKWVQALHALTAQSNKTDQLRVENLAQATLRFSLISFHAPWGGSVWGV